MRIKSLLLGSAAASMVAVSGAQAADAIVTYVEPEPVEYVRVCDIYGAGFFYIPGTETCLRISGFARYQMGATSNSNPLRGNPQMAPAPVPGFAWQDTGMTTTLGAPIYAQVGPGGATGVQGLGTPANAMVIGTQTPNYHGFTDGSWNKYARGRVNFDARTETEWGTLRGYVRVEGTGGQTVNAAGNAVMPWVFVSLGTQQGELLAGFLESAWAWGGPIGNYGMHSDFGGQYGFQRRSQIRYTFSAAEGFFGVLSLEDNSGRLGTAGRYMPDVVGKAGISQAWGGVYGAAAYDAVDRSWAARVGAEINIPNAPGSSVLGKFFWSNSPTNAYTPHGMDTLANLPLGARWSAMASFQHQFTPEFAVGAGYQHIRHFAGALGVGSPRTHYVDATAIWTPVPDLEVRAELGYARFQATGVNVSGSWSGMLRFQRSF